MANRSASLGWRAVELNRSMTARSNWWPPSPTGSDRHRECTIVRGRAAAYAGAYQIAGTADGDIRGAPGNFKLAERARVPYSRPCSRMRPVICEANFGTLIAVCKDGTFPLFAQRRPAGLRRIPAAQALSSASSSGRSSWSCCRDQKSGPARLRYAVGCRLYIEKDPLVCRRVELAARGRCSVSDAQGGRGDRRD